MIPASNTRWSFTAIHNKKLVSCQIPGFEDYISHTNWSTPNGVIFDISEEKLTDEMTIHIRYLEKDINFKLEKMKGEE